MKKGQLFFTLILISIISFGQDKLVEFSPQIKYNHTSYNISVNQDDSLGFALFFYGSKEMNAILFDKDFEVAENLIFKEKYIKYGGNIVAQIFNDNEYTFYNWKGSNLLYSTISFENKSIIGGYALDMSLMPGFEIARTMVVGKKLYVFTAKENWGLLNIYEFSGRNNMKHYRFAVKPEVSNLLINNYSRVPALQYDNCIPDYKNQYISTLYSLSNTRKCHVYYYEQKFIITIDELKSNYLLVLDLQNEKKTEQTFNYGKKKKTTISVFGDKVFQLVISKDSLHLFFNNITCETILKQYNISSSDTLYFSNTPIFMDYKGPGSKLEYYDKFDDALYNLNYAKISLLAIDRINGLYKIGIGSRECRKKAFGVISDAVSQSQNLPGMSFKYFKFGSYFECLFDGETFEHKEGEVPEWDYNFFETTNKIDEIKKNTLDSYSKFLYEDEQFYYFGKYIWKTKLYKIVKIEK